MVMQGAYTNFVHWICSLSDLLQISIMVVVLFLMSGLCFYAIGRLENKNRTVAKIINVFRNGIDFVLGIAVIMICFGYLFWLINLLTNVVKYLNWSKTLNLIRTDAVYFGLYWFARQVVRILDLICRRFKAFDYTKEYEWSASNSSKKLKDKTNGDEKKHEGEKASTK